MRTCFLLIAIAAALSAQTPAAATPDTIVAKVAGKDVTLGEVKHMLELDPRLMQAFQKDPVAAIRDAFLVQHLAAEAEKLKLADEPQWKEQIELSRKVILAQAMTTHERNFYDITPAEVDKYYQANQARFTQAEIKVIKIAFKPGVKESTSLEDIARTAVQGEHAGSDRSEEDARKLANQVVQKLRAGGDFAQFLIYSDDAESKTQGGDFGTVKPTSAYSNEFKKAVLALKPGEVSDPIPTGPAFYIVRVEKRSVQPLNEVRAQITDELKNAHLNEYFANLQKKFTPTIERPDALVQMNVNMNRPAPK